MLSLGGLKSIHALSYLVGQDIVAKSLALSQASGSNGLVLITAGARLKFSSGGTQDYMTSDGVATITAAGSFVANAVISQTVSNSNTLTLRDTSNSISWYHILSTASGLYTFYNTNTQQVMQLIQDGTAKVCAGTPAPSSTLATLGGILNVNTTTVGNVGVGEDDLMTYQLPANSLTATGRGIRYHGLGTIANDVNAKTLKIYFGASLISVVIPISIAGAWEATATIIRTGLNAQYYDVVVNVTNTTTNAVSGVFVATGTLTQTETAGITIKATATATTDNDVTQTRGVTSYF